ncbi:MAG TPA: nitrogenase component 1, partial [Armatimonadota bacterium]|nr:nitrogenase component 1 [Armatimonadota bacterium]
SFAQEHAGVEMPYIVPVSTPSYQGSHIDGFHAAVYAVVQQLAQGGPRNEAVGLFPGLVSAADLRWLKTVMQDFGLEVILVPDYSETLDGPAWEAYQKIPEGGTPVGRIKQTGRCRAAIQLGYTVKRQQNAARWLRDEFGTPDYQLGLPVGIRETDCFLQVLADVSGKPVPENYRKARGRLVDAYIDGHKYLFGKKAVLYGEPDLVLALAVFLAELGVIPVLCATGTETGRLTEELARLLPELVVQVKGVEGVDFAEIEAEVAELKPDLLVGNSKGYAISRKLGIPLVRAGFPVHDRIGGQRLLHLGYEGTQRLFDTVVNELIAVNQEQSPVGYSYM